MRLLYLLATLATSTTAIEIPFLNAISLPITLEDYFGPGAGINETANEQRQRHLHKRQDGCPNSFHACSNLGAAGLCCADAAVCQADDAGNVACCPSSSSCTGQVNGVIKSGTVNSEGSVIAGGGGGGGAGRTTQASQPIASNSAGVVISSNTPGQTTPGPSGSGFVLNNGNSGNGSTRSRGEVVSTHEL